MAATALWAAVLTARTNEALSQSTSPSASAPEITSSGSSLSLALWSAMPGVFAPVSVISLSWVSSVLSVMVVPSLVAEFLVDERLHGVVVGSECGLALSAVAVVATDDRIRQCVQVGAAGAGASGE